MNSSTSVPKPGEGSGLWFLKILTGLLIIVILAVHFTVNHILGSMAGLLTYQEVVKYYASNPIIPLMEILFVIFAVTHSLLGLRSIILDMNPSLKTLKTVNWVFTAIGVVAIVYGIGLVLVLLARGAAAA